MASVSETLKAIRVMDRGIREAAASISNQFIVDHLRTQAFAKEILDQTAMLQSIADMRRIEESLGPFREFTRQLDEIVSVSPFLLADFEASIFQAEALGSMARTQDAAREIGRQLEALGQGSRSVTSFAEQARLSLATKGPLLTGLFDDVSTSLRHRLEAEPDTEIQLAQVVELSSQHISELAAEEVASLDLMQLLNLMLTLFFALLLSHRTDSLVQDGFDDVEVLVHEGQTEILAVLEELVSASTVEHALPEGVEETHFLSRDLHLRAGPTGESESLHAFSVGTHVQGLWQIGGWMQVAVQVPSADGPLIGWMYARYLRPLE